MKQTNEQKKATQRESMKELRQAFKDSGLIKVEIWVNPDKVAKIKGFDESALIPRSKVGRKKKEI